MLCMNVEIKKAKKVDQEKISQLFDCVFGPGRFSRTAFRVREHYKGHEDYGFCSWSGDTVIGSIHFTPITIGGTSDAYLLGPLVVSPNFSGQNLGCKLIEAGILNAIEKKCRVIVLVGDISYYGRFGFQHVPQGQIRFSGPADPERILVRELEPNSLKEYAGIIAAAQATRVR